MLRLFVRFLLWLRFWLFQRLRHNRLVLEHVNGRPFLVLPGVFNPTLFRSSELFAKSLSSEWIRSGSTVLDMGTGSGIGAVYAAQWAAHVVAVDVNPEAVCCARINVLLNHVDDRVEVREGDLFEPVCDMRFDAILFNPPFFRGRPRDVSDFAWRSEDVAERFAAGLRGRLAPGGCAWVILSSLGDDEAFLRAFRANGFQADVMLRRDLLSEVMTIYRIGQGPCV